MDATVVEVRGMLRYASMTTEAVNRIEYRFEINNQNSTVNNS
jgi:hypothetical protein